MKREFICICLLALPGSSASAVISGSINITTDYLFKGVSLSGETPALQPYVEYANDAGYYVSAWESNIDFRATDQHNQPVRYATNEVDITSGYRWAVGATALDAGLGTYTYFGNTDSVQADQSKVRARDINYFDLYFRATRNDTAIAYSYAPDYAGQKTRHSIFMISQGVQLPAEIMLRMSASYLYSHDNPGYYQQGNAAGYTHYSVGVQKRAAHLDWAFALETQNSTGDFGGRFTPVLTVSLPF